MSSEQAPQTVLCSRHREVLPAITSRLTFVGDFAERIRLNVSQRAWVEWLDMQIKVINEYRLHLGDPNHRQFLQDMAGKFFGLDGEPSDLGVGPEGGLSGKF